MLIVTLPAERDVESTIRMISALKGVTDVDYHYTTRKLRVLYEVPKDGGDIQDEIRRIVAGIIE